MANRTDTSAKHIHGMNPQYILETILRNKIYNSMYWKEKCFALTSETIIDKAIELKYIGGTVGGNKTPTDFMCLVLKLLQIQPDKDIIIEYLNNKDYKYLSALAAYYVRLTSKAKDVYLDLEPLYVDYRKLRVRNPDGTFKVIMIYLYTIMAQL
jgi:pre-mRNA-splicing factor 38A